MKKYKIGYTQGVFDMFHIGHLNILNRAKDQCEYLIVGVNADTLVENYKHKTPVINENDRIKIVGNIKCVDRVVLANTLDKKEQYKRLGFDAIFIGSDWKGNPRWESTREEMKQIGVEVVFLPHTEGITSSILRNVRDEQVGE